MQATHKQTRSSARLSDDSLVTVALRSRRREKPLLCDVNFYMTALCSGLNDTGPAHLIHTQRKAAIQIFKGKPRNNLEGRGLCTGGLVFLADGC